MVVWGGKRRLSAASPGCEARSTRLTEPAQFDILSC
jgi:hypothetical protein